MSQENKSARAIEIERQFRSMSKPERFDLAQERLNTRDAHVLTGVPRDVLMEWETVAGVRCIRMRPQGARADREVIFLHGGAYCLMSAMSHHRFGGHIARAARADVLIPDYSLAPEAPFPAARDECVAIARQRRATRGGKQVLAGDSAGAGLVLSVACALRDAGEPLPDALVLMSPWLDLGLTGPALQAQAIDDSILAIGNLTAMADMYRGNHAIDDPGVSPLFADHHRLPPTLLQMAELDLLRDDGERLAQHWPQNQRIKVQCAPGMLHSYQMFAGDMPEADHAIEGIAVFLNDVL